MNADRLLAHYERIADAPDAVPRLRRFILALSVRGKLAEQDPNDEPAGELLKRIAKEKARLVKAGEARDKPSLLGVAAEDKPFAVPEPWRWVRFANIVDFSAGRTPSRNDLSFWNTGDHAWVSIADMDDGQVLTTTKETVSDKARELVFRSEPKPPGTIIMSFKLTIGTIARLGIPAFHNEAIIAIRPHLADLDAYLFKMLPAFARQGGTKGAIKGATLNRKSISNILFPLPPLAEQHRIVARVDELMALCDRLERARANREATRDRLAAAGFARLDAPDPDPMVFRNHVAFALEHLTPLTTRRDQIKALRQTILNLAVRGKLAEQDPNDEPAGELLKRIAKEKARLVKAGEARDKRSLLGVATEDKPFDVPEPWRWVRFANIVDFSAGRTPSRNDLSFWNTGDHAWVSIADMDDGQVLTTTKETVGDKARELVFRSEPKPPGTIIMSFKLTIGTIARLGIPAFHNEAIIAIRPHLADLDAYLFKMLPGFARQGGTKGAIKGATLNRESISNILFPLPPLAEQHRIVAKVDELMALCDRLETSLATADDTRCGLLGALLIEALQLGGSHVSKQSGSSGIRVGR